VRDGPVAWLPLWRQQGLLRFDGLVLERHGGCRLEGAVGFYATGQAPCRIGSASRLLACLAPALDARPEGVRRLQIELDNSVEHDTRGLLHRAAWAGRLSREAGGSETFYGWLHGRTDGNPGLLLEQWGTLGHPWHPCHKTKLGLDGEALAALSPEFEASVPLPLYALRADHAHVETAQPGLAYRDWFAARFAAPWDAWCRALAARGEPIERWLPLPVHPLQAERTLPEAYRDEIASGVLLPLTAGRWTASPTMSWRTVVPGGAPDLPHVKLPVALRLTSVQRTLSPKSAVMGPRLTALLRRVLRDEGGFGGALDLLGEEVGVHYRLPPEQDERARHLAALFRENPMSRRREGRFPYPVGALFADSPLDGQPLVAELVRLSGREPLAFFREYLQGALRALLSPYLLYGIAFEAHQQNSFVLLDARGRPGGLLLRDFGDLRLHRPTLARRGLDLPVHRAGHTAFDDEEPVRDKLLHAAFLCHFAELGLLIGRLFGLPEDAVWRALREETQRRFDALRERTDPQRWAAERAALLEAPWPAKAFLRMRLHDRSDDLHGRMPNPLRER
jgi:siderophore synthetase component